MWFLIQRNKNCQQLTLEGSFDWIAFSIFLPLSSCFVSGQHYCCPQLTEHSNRLQMAENRLYAGKRTQIHMQARSCVLLHKRRHSRNLHKCFYGLSSLSGQTTSNLPDNNTFRLMSETFQCNSVALLSTEVCYLLPQSANQVCSTGPCIGT